MKWVILKDEPPHFDKSVIVWDGKRIFVATRTRSSGGVLWYVECSEELFGSHPETVLAWMNLPEPPSKDEMD